MAKDLTFQKLARNRLLSGLNKLADAVKITAGPKGRNALIERKYGAPLIANDGVTIAKEIELSDAIENMGAKLIAEAAISTNDIAGDGTTTATILTQEMVNKAIEAINAGANPVNIRKGIDEAAHLVGKYLTKISKPINTKEEIAQVGAISSGSKQIGQLIAKAMEIVGKSGVITIDDAKTLNTTLETTEGLEFKGGYGSPYMVTDHEKMIAVLDEAKILVSANKINTVKELLPLLEGCMEASVPLVIVATDFSDEVVTTLAVNKLRGTLNVITVKCNEYGDRQRSVLEDLAVTVGTKLIDASLGLDLKSIKLEDLGSAGKITIGKEKTTVIDGHGDRHEIDEHIKTIQGRINAIVDDKYAKDMLQERLAAMSKGVAVIRVGGATEVAQKELKLRIEDALNSTKAAVAEGIVPGGGIAFMNAIPEIAHLNSDDKEITIGYDIVREALKAPARQIIENSGYNSSKTINYILNQGLGVGFNAESGEYVDMIRSGIIDPTKVTKTALEKAASVASLMITTEVAISDIKEKDSQNQFGE
ncbi:chaperonin GroEL [[Mycoplasma] testudinis]|uniref:chaperonin GroEL n=1 Tax=[Mycoplasma] testudinis TaxID=33924 RepID=UPI000489FCB0|nr:chaperonin GroEL [[Mycoplasma] testudinis]